MITSMSRELLIFRTPTCTTCVEKKFKKHFCKTICTSKPFNLTCILWFHHKSLNTNLCEFHCWVNAYQNESIHLDNKWYCFTQVSDSSSLWNIEILLNPQKLMSTILDETTLLYMYMYLFVDFKRLIIDTIHS